LSGETASSDPITYGYENTGSGFTRDTNSNSKFWEIAESDYERDGSIEFFASAVVDGEIRTEVTGGSASAEATPPAPPTELSVESVDPQAGTLTASWTGAQSATAPTEALSYDVYIREKQEYGGDYLVTAPGLPVDEGPFSILETAIRTLETRGNAGLGTSTTFRGLDLSEDVVYEIGVRAVDPSHRGSAYFKRTRFTASGPASEEVASDTRSVDESDAEGDEAVTFEDTGVSVDFSTGTTGSGTVSVEKKTGEPVGTAGIDEENVSDFRYSVDADKDLDVGDGTEIQFAAETVAGIQDVSNVQVYKRETEGVGTFEPVETTVDRAGTPDKLLDDTLSAKIGGFSEFAFASSTAPLPVEMAGFEATPQNGDVRLQWRTASESGNAGFEVQRRAFGDAPSGWVTAGFVESNAPGGTTSRPQRYRFVDDGLPFAADSARYRLRQVDTDGTARYSGTVTVARRTDRTRLLRTAPNPARQRVRVRFAVPEPTEATVRLYDLLGRRVRTFHNGRISAGRSEVRAEVSDLSPGVYFVRLDTGDAVRTRRLTVVE
jgi:hypothetical protein